MQSDAADAAAVLYPSPQSDQSEHGDHTKISASSGTTPPDAIDPMLGHLESREALIDLVFASNSQPDFLATKSQSPNKFGWLETVVGPNTPARANQGNRQIARHTISKQACLDNLKGITIQTPEQQSLCGAGNMVPIWGSNKKPSFCIDVFEFPNKACELPLVWVAPSQAQKLCKMQGKRLCDQGEWNLACRADPDGTPDRRYAYGDELDLTACHTNTPHRQACNTHDAMAAFRTCTTDTEPSGSFPQCRSRFGVFDQHGNVAEIMTRREGGQTLTQLKGSAWFYVEVAREPNAAGARPSSNGMNTYPDHCNFDPRWHVENIESAWHVNYHLGFRCCKSIQP